MKRFLAGVVALVATSLPAQTAADFNEGLVQTYTHVSENGSPRLVFNLSWWGRAGRTYFLQGSDNLTAWSYFPVIESGGDAVITYGFTANAPRFFTRLQYIDQTAPDVYAADFDGDGVSNGMEIQRGLNPLLADADTDGDGMPDAWETAYGLDPLLSNAAADADGDGVSNFDEYKLGRNPAKAALTVSADALALRVYLPR